MGAAIIPTLLVWGRVAVGGAIATCCTFSEKCPQLGPTHKSTAIAIAYQNWAWVRREFGRNAALLLIPAEETNTSLRRRGRSGACRSLAKIAQVWSIPEGLDSSDAPQLAAFRAWYAGAGSPHSCPTDDQTALLSSLYHV